MGGVWCKAEKGASRTSSPKIPFNSTIARWTNHVRQAYRKPKPPRHRPPRPPQKPLRSNNRLTISHPQLVPEDSSGGWRTATLLVPESAPVPPPRKKRKHNSELSRAAFSMDDLRHPEPLPLTNKHASESGLDLRTSFTTLVVTPVLEARREHPRVLEEKTEEENKENILKSPIVQEKRKEEDEEELAPEDLPEEIIPIEKETLYSSRTLLHSSLGYVDKLSAISEVSTVSTESGFEDRLDLGKSSELSGSVTSSESAPVESGLNILAHIQNIANVSQLSDSRKDVKEKTAISKKEWLQNILKEEPEPFFLTNGIDHDSRVEEKSVEQLKDLHTEPITPCGDNVQFRKREASECDNKDNKTPTPPPSPASGSISSSNCDKNSQNNHSVLLELLQANKLPEEKPSIPNPFFQKEETIFLKDTKTNIIYKTLSSDKLSEVFDDSFITPPEEKNIDCKELQFRTSSSKLGEEVKENSPSEGNSTSANLVKDSTLKKSHLDDCFFHSPQLVSANSGLNKAKEEVPKSNPSAINFTAMVKSQSHESALKNLPLIEDRKEDKKTDAIVNGITSESSDTRFKKSSEVGTVDETIEKITTKEEVNKESISSSRRSSITDSLHEFELSIYDMLKESKKNRDSSDEEESLKTVKT